MHDTSFAGRAGPTLIMTIFYPPESQSRQCDHEQVLLFRKMVAESAVLISACLMRMKRTFHR